MDQYVFMCSTTLSELGTVRSRPEGSVLLTFYGELLLNLLIVRRFIWVYLSSWAGIERHRERVKKR